MTREDIKREILSLKGSNWLLELPTGTGKTRLAIEKIKSLCKGKDSMLIVVPRNVLKQNWKEELNKWWPNCPLNIEYTTYVSYPKYKGKWGFVLYDEAHHLSERCREALCNFEVKHSILLSATVGKSLKDELKEVFDNLVFYKKDLRNIIEEEILPDPRVYLMPIFLKTGIPTESIWKNTKAKGQTVEVCWDERWKFLKQKTNPVRIFCSQKQYMIDLDSQIEFWKKRHMSSRTIATKNKWLRLCSDRLKWLSDKKTPLISEILEHLKDYRTLTFCNNVEQTELLGEYCINSKNKESSNNLDKFNKGEINHITACNILNEGRHYMPLSI